MLCLTRRLDEEVIVEMPDGRIVRVRVGEVRADRVRLLFDAPQDVRIDRREVYERRRPE
jgi:carbon storage regulator CsrA